MSDRDLLLQRTALSSTLRGLKRQASLMQKRSRWPSATQFVEAGVVAVPASVITTIATIALDPGNWMIQASAVPESSFYNITLTLELEGANGIPAVSNVIYGGFGPGTVAMNAIGFASIVSAGDVVNLRLTSTQVASSTQAFIIAVPT